VQHHNNGWQKSELEALNASAMDIERIHHLIANIDNNLNGIKPSPIDARKLQDLKVFFQRELRKRGA
jgi:hypothetical protein